MMHEQDRRLTDGVLFYHREWVTKFEELLRLQMQRRQRGGSRGAQEKSHRPKQLKNQALQWVADALAPAWFRTWELKIQSTRQLQVAVAA
jgi:hypothetical protein